MLCVEDEGDVEAATVFLCWGFSCEKLEEIPGLCVGIVFEGRGFSCLVEMVPVKEHCREAGDEFVGDGILRCEGCFGVEGAKG